MDSSAESDASGRSGTAPCCSAGFLGICQLFHHVGELLGLKVHEEEDARVKFEKTVLFLASVPIFKTQLPRAELPKVAQALLERKWRPGAKLVNRGEIGNSFFLIYSGAASVISVDADGHEHESAELGPGDWLGGHTLTAERLNTMTIRAKGPQPLVTLSMSKRQFEESGLKERLRFPKRPAMHVSTQAVHEQVARALGESGNDHPCHAASWAAPSRPPKSLHRALFSASSMLSLQSEHTTHSHGFNCQEVSRDDQIFIVDAMMRNANLHACFAGLEDCEDDNRTLECTTPAASRRSLACSPSPAHDNESVIKRIAAWAERRLVREGEVVARKGDIGQELFIVQSGTFEVIVGDPDRQNQQHPSTASWSVAKLKRRVSGALEPETDARASSSAESAAAVFSMAERLRRKQGFMVQLHKPAEVPCDGRGCHSWTAQQIRRDPSAETGRPKRRARTRSLLTLKKGEEVRSRSKRHATAVVTLSSGDCFGELSLLYNVRREATFRAVEDSVVYTISRRHFKQCASQSAGGARRFQAYCALLDEVDVLTGLLRAERRELACNASVVSFRPHQRVLQQGKVRELQRWYVIYSGSAIMSKRVDGSHEEQVLNEIGRSGHFGERSLLRAYLHNEGDSPKTATNRCCSEVNIDAGPEGMTCLTFDGIMVLDLLKGLVGLDPSVPDVDCDIEQWCTQKNFRSRKLNTKPVELERLTEVTLLGRGNFGNVFLARNSADRRLYALKRMSKGYIMSTGFSKQLGWERDLMTMLDSPFIVKLVSSYKDAQFVYLLMEACMGGDLYALLRNYPDLFTEDSPRGYNTAFYAACIAAALEHLHERNIVYRDLKPENILLDTAGYGKLCDMGLARFVRGKANTQAGTPDYMAPEVIHFPHWHDSTADWWSYGCVVFELLSGQTPFDDEGLDDSCERLLAIMRSQDAGPPHFPFSCPSMAKALVVRLLQKVPNRLGSEGGADEVRRHVFFQQMSFDFEALNARSARSPVQPPWQEPDSPRPPRHFLSTDTDWHDELFAPYFDDGSGWDKDF